ncbi:MAG: aminotransferase class V-fold PLP-dependent enzyme, partial [Clostridia bacterium]|nr:aminotransferase class V-fold PLP-dependent enzyme [Clostridia bacterium]
MNKLVYADNAATTKVSESVLNAMLPYFSESYGNASSLYTHGQNSKKAINAAREPIAKLINADPTEIFFTGSGTESDNMVIRGVLNSVAAKNKGRNHIITTKIEHPAILRTCEVMQKQGYEVTYLNVDHNGVISLEELENAITEKTALISVMAANNEIGSIQPLKEIGEIAKKHNVLFHTDAVQALGHMHIDVQEMNISLMSLSAHKIHGPKGVGAIYIKKNVFPDPIITGGGQERNRRSGTENVPGIVGFGQAAQDMIDHMDEDNAHTAKLSKRLMEGLLKIKKSVLTGHPTNRLPGTCSFAFEAIEGESMILLLSMKGICASTGSACSTG